MNRILRPKFDRHADYVAVGYPKKGLNANYKLGEELIDVPVWRKRSLYRKKKIGIKGHPWTEKMLAIKRHRQEKFAKLSKKEIEKGRDLGPSEIANLEVSAVDIGSITAPAAEPANKSVNQSGGKKTDGKSKTKSKSKPKPKTANASKSKVTDNGTTDKSANSATNGRTAGGQ